MGILFEILRFAVVLRFGEVVALDDVEMFNLGLNFEGR
jgi:hypothetical protein